MSVDKLILFIKSHPCFNHPIFINWAEMAPDQVVVGALFHQIRSFCDSTRPAHAFSDGLVKNGLAKESCLVQQIAESEEDHGPELATMAGYILNKMSKNIIFSDLYDQNTIEAYLKSNSDSLLGHLPGYDRETGLLIQTKVARNVFEGRKKTDLHSVLKNLGAMIALEMISNGQLIPGEKHCLIDSGLYKVSLEDKEMHYLAEHWGEAGAEAMHEQTAQEAVKAVMTADNKDLVFSGAKDFLDSLLALWDTLNAALLGSGYLRKVS
ncbi:MAG: hypothetical protein A3F18_06985 [Legionellales bacterium RIFCSPHIGHO2_12_FULL_37_14]|nr:MAG: hypothetical protein A3F18_06985 [Legionellales bacterium RIFCSPHIGHO2_12_FULL_37_14]